MPNQRWEAKRLTSAFPQSHYQGVRKHGMMNIGYWAPDDAPLVQNILIYVLAHPSREAAMKNWAAFRADSEWQKVKAKSKAGGQIVSEIDSAYMKSTVEVSLEEADGQVRDGQGRT